jgi:hypothetical protein
MLVTPDPFPEMYSIMDLVYRIKDKIRVTSPHSPYLFIIGSSNRYDLLNGVPPIISITSI